MDDRFEVAAPLDLRRTLGPLELLGGGAMRFTGPGEAWRATWTGTGPASLRLQVAADAGTVVVTATAWGPGAAAALAAAPQLVGRDDDPGALVAHHRLVGDLHRRYRGLRIGRTGAVFEALVPAILGQKVAGKEAARSYRRLVAGYGETAPGPVDLRLPPRPELLAAMPYEAFHPLGIERRRATVIIEAARHAGRLEALAAAGLEAASPRLQSLRGVGPWTAALVAGAALGDPDAVPVGDYHIPSTVAWALEGRARGDDAAMLRLLAPYAGQRRRVLLLLAAGGIRAPRFGPRRALRSIERI